MYPFDGTDVRYRVAARWHKDGRVSYTDVDAGALELCIKDEWRRLRDVLLGVGRSGELEDETTTGVGPCTEEEGVGRTETETETSSSSSTISPSSWSPCDVMFDIR